MADIEGTHLIDRCLLHMSLSLTKKKVLGESLVRHNNKLCKNLKEGKRGYEI
jgi:hypothetical protein